MNDLALLVVWTMILIGLSWLTHSIYTDTRYPRQIAKIQTINNDEARKFLHQCTGVVGQSAVIKNEKLLDGWSYTITCFRGHGNVNE